MTLWLALALMTGLSVFMVLYPLSRRPAGVAATDRDVYLAQLAELEHEQRQGLLNPEDADSARIEVSRRVLAAKDSALPQDVSDAQVFARRLFIVAALVLVPVSAIGTYVLTGSPLRPDEPLATRLAAPAADDSLQNLVTRVERVLAENPDNAQAAQVLAPIYMRTGQFDKAAKAHAAVIRVLGSTAEREEALGEALVMQAEGTVTPLAKAAFERAYAQNAQRAMPRYYLGLAARQAGDTATASRLWQQMVRAAADDAPWLARVREALAELAMDGLSPAPLLSPEEGRDIRQAPPKRQRELIAGMVDRLQARMEADKASIDLRLRFIRSAFGLGERDRAAAALQEGLSLFASQSEAVRRLSDLQLGLGLEEKAGQ
jgi:cytochrome c-type biogenesis protein CcmH